MNIFESLENLNVSEECFDDITSIIESIINEVSFGKWTDTAKKVLPLRKGQADAAKAREDAKRKEHRSHMTSFADAYNLGDEPPTEKRLKKAEKETERTKERAEHAEDVADVGDRASKAGEATAYKANANKFLDLVKKDRFVRKMDHMGGEENFNKKWASDYVHNADPLKNKRKLKKK